MIQATRQSTTSNRSRALGRVGERQKGGAVFCCAPTVSHLPGVRRRRHLHLRHYPVGKAGGRREARELHQLENNLALALRFDAAKRAIREMHGPGGGKQPLRPELDFVGSEMHRDVSHWLSYGSVKRR